MKWLLRGLCFAGAALGAMTAQAVPIVTSASGANAASIQASVDAFRASLGTLNPNTAGSVGSGRREINWDGVPDALSAPNLLPANFFNVNSPRGVVFSSPGSGFQVSANAGVAPVRFGNLDAAYTNQFAAFSQQRLFTALGSNITDVDFFVPGSTTAATSNAFGAVFTDVDVANATMLQFFDANGASLGSFAVAAATGDATLSFLGVRFDEGVTFSRVRITSGNAPLTSGPTAGDVVAMDDFIYAEPIAAPVPEPGMLGLFAAGLAALATRGRFARRTRATTQPSPATKSASVSGSGMAWMLSTPS